VPAKRKQKYEKDPSSLKSRHKNLSQPNLKDNVGHFGLPKNKITRKILIYMTLMTLGRSRISKYAVYNGLDKERRKICRPCLGHTLQERYLEDTEGDSTITCYWNLGKQVV
jgi:hypothetical protein